MKILQLIFCACLALCASVAGAQVPRINTLFPIGGRAGETVEVEIRGSSLTGAERLMVEGGGVTGEVQPGGNKADETNRPVWQAKCASCHELRSPANRSMTPGQWAATVDRMVKVRQAPLSADEAAKVTLYLQSAARAGQMTARLTIAPDTLPGLREVRVVTPHGVSTAALFEVGSLPEVMAVPGHLAQPQSVTLPCVANGTLAANGERHYFKFAAQMGQRLVFNLKAFRYRDLTQTFFNPDLRLYDARGNELVENHGYYELDPLIDWTAPQAGDYTLEVRDLLGKGNPGSVYRLAMGAVPYDTVVYPPAAHIGDRFTAQVAGKDLVGAPRSFSTTAPDQPGITQIDSPWGPQPLYVSRYPVVQQQSGGQTVALPATLVGRFAAGAAAQVYNIQGSGRWAFEVYTGRLGSPADARVNLLNPEGKRQDGVNGERRFVTNLDPGKVYHLSVEEAEGRAGDDYVYAIVAFPARPYLEAVVRPDNVLVRPGASTAVEVLVTQRDGIDGDVIVNAEGLPAGVTARTTVVQPDRQRAWLILDASPNAAVSAQPFVVRASGKSGNDACATRCLAQEEYRINNNPQYINRQSGVISVGPQPDFQASLNVADSIRVDPKKGIEVKVKLQRRNGYKGAVTARIDGLPQGWTANAEGIPGDRDEATLLVRPSGENTQPFLKRDPALTPINAIVEVIEDEVPYVVGTLRVDKPATDPANKPGVPAK